MGTFGQIETVSALLTRRADAAAYAALDAVTNETAAAVSLKFAGAAAVGGGGGYIVKARLTTNRSTDTERFRLHLFHTDPAVPNDNAPFTLLDANKAKRIGHIDFPPLSTEGAGSDASHASNYDVRMAFDLAADDDKIYGILETLDAFNPASGQTFHVELLIDAA